MDSNDEKAGHWKCTNGLNEEKKMDSSRIDSKNGFQIYDDKNVRLNFVSNVHVKLSMWRSNFI